LTIAAAAHVKRDDMIIRYEMRREPIEIMGIAAQSVDADKR